MAKKHSTRRKVRKPKLIEIEGHQLTEAMLVDYHRCQCKLNDFISGYRPSRKVPERLLEICRQATASALAVGQMKDFNFPKGPVRAAGCQLLKDMAEDLFNACKKLSAVVNSVETEEHTKLQDWLAQDEQYAKIGTGPVIERGGS
jgi:hypothetical protein